MDFEFEISKKNGLILLSGLLVIGGLFGVYAATVADGIPYVDGHSDGEIQVIYGGESMSLTDAFGISKNKNLECHFSIVNEQTMNPPLVAAGTVPALCDKGLVPEEDYFPVSGDCRANNWNHKNCKYDNIEIHQGSQDVSYWGGYISPNSGARVAAVCCRSKLIL
ncbi:hypothetical protein HN604_03015 [archaeon]|jgi:hypothetical protein|nr:hypothetical protein [archaeon]MBT6183034.1 hypothetical protein [archaeon]MBT6606499.1 hypothetical protein [archaeon]MBT7251336.1 hypothetical protein [archaeon]MBT7661029.1 hypothetical protein [archaeon]